MRTCPTTNKGMTRACSFVFLGVERVRRGTAAESCVSHSHASSDGSSDGAVGAHRDHGATRAPARWPNARRVVARCKHIQIPASKPSAGVTRVLQSYTAVKPLLKALAVLPLLPAVCCS